MGLTLARARNLVLWCGLALLLTACSGGTASVGGIASPGPGPGNSGSLSVAVDTSGLQPSALARGTSTGGLTIVVDVLEPQTRRPVASAQATASSANPQAEVQILSLAPSTYVVHLSIFDSHGQLLFSGEQVTAVNVGQVSQVTFNAFAGSGSPAQLAFVSQPASGQAGQTLGNVEVAVEDAAGNLVPGATNQITVALGQGSGSAGLGGTVSVAPVNGVATFSNLVVDTAGSGYTLVATSPGLAQGVSNSFDLTLSRGALELLPNSPYGSLDIPVRGAINPTTNPNEEYLYVAEFGGTQVQGFKIDPASGDLSPTPGSPYPAVDQPGAVIFSPDGTYVYVSNANTSSNDINSYQLDPSTGSLTSLGSTPSGGQNPLDGQVRPIISPATSPFLYVVDFYSDDVAALDASGGTLSTLGATVPLTGTTFGPSNVVLNPDGHYAYTDNGAVLSINQNDGSLTQVGTFAVSTGGIVIVNPGGTLLYTGGDHQIRVYDLSNPGQPVQINGSPFATAENVQELAFSADGHFLYTDNKSNGNIRIYALDPTTGAPAEIGDSPVATGAGGLFGFQVDPQGNFVYVEDYVDGQVIGLKVVH